LLVLNPHDDDSPFGVIARTQGPRYHPSEAPHVARAPTHDEDLLTKPARQQSYGSDQDTDLLAGRNPGLGD
jgi:hypothetical protein